MSLSNALLRLRDQSAHLNDVTDAAIRALSVVEKFLQQVNVGVTAFVEIGEHTVLSFDRYGSEYRILVEDPNETRAWQECPRATKIRAAAHLQKLVDALLNEVEKQSAEALAHETVLEIARVAATIDRLEGTRNAK